MTLDWTVELSGPARRALDTALPPAVAWAAFTFITERLPTNPHRLGAPLAEPYEGLMSAHLGTYRVIYRIDEPSRTIVVASVAFGATFTVFANYASRLSATARRTAATFFASAFSG